MQPNRDPWLMFAGKRVLLLQGPMGPFFRHVAARLREAGATIDKIDFNLADSFYYQPEAGARLYRGTLEQWPEYLAAFISENALTTLIVFGDCRRYHREAIKCARLLGLEVFVFEEGYLRPSFITLERDGVNGNSRISRDPAYYRAIETRRLPLVSPVPHAYAWGVLHSIVYSVILSLLGWVTPHYRHHRDLNCVRQGLLWLRGGFRRLANTFRDRNFAERLLSQEGSNYFLVPLQVHLDSQLSHSDFEDISEFIALVVRSFVLHAPATSCLVIKEHPLDRAYRDYAAFIAKLRNEYALGPRLQYVDVVNLPTALEHARGTVVINSTVGLSSLIHLTPTVCLGKAIYDIPGLTFQGSLDEFWQNPGHVDRDLAEKFVYWLRTTTQLPGTVWSGFL